MKCDEKKYQKKYQSGYSIEKSCIFAADLSPGGEIGRHATLRG